jgi:outer membrane protein TolC
MARRSSNGRLDEATANLASAQANLVNNQPTFQANFMALAARTDERLPASRLSLPKSKPFFSDTNKILMRHEQILQALPEAIREKTGFQPRGS